MAVGSRIRKILWAKSGNRCAICRIELVQAEIQEKNVIIGEECHIVSSKENGPRGKESLQSDDFDGFEHDLLLFLNYFRHSEQMP